MRLIALTKGAFAKVSDQDFERVSMFRWSLSEDHRWGRKVAVRGYRLQGKSITEKMHRYIMSPASDQVVDHIDGDTLNNQRENLRLCTRAQNAQNVHVKPRAGAYRGVRWHSQRGKWVAKIGVSGRSIHLGLFLDAAEAARAYDRAAREHFGEFAITNFNLGGAVCGSGPSASKLAT